MYQTKGKGSVLLHLSPLGLKPYINKSFTESFLSFYRYTDDLVGMLAVLDEITEVLNEHYTQYVQSSKHLKGISRADFWAKCALSAAEQGRKNAGKSNKLKMSLAQKYFASFPRHRPFEKLCPLTRAEWGTISIIVVCLGRKESLKRFEQWSYHSHSQNQERYLTNLHFKHNLYDYNLMGGTPPPPSPAFCCQRTLFYCIMLKYLVLIHG